MRTGRAAGVADEADQVALAYLNALLDAGREFGKMAIDRGELPRMIAADPVAISAICRCAHNNAVGRSVCRRAGRRREIDALMHEHRGNPPQRNPRWGMGRRSGCRADPRYSRPLQADRILCCEGRISSRLLPPSPDIRCHKFVTAHVPVAKDCGTALGHSSARECGRFRKRRCRASTLPLAVRLMVPGERRVARGRHRARDRRHEVVQ
jgi:hypothetical protein